ncbi:MAG: hypothetical protein ACKPKO_49735, partial [Candidatus Fonsibacter sp.]
MIGKAAHKCKPNVTQSLTIAWASGFADSQNAECDRQVQSFSADLTMFLRQQWSESQGIIHIPFLTYYVAMLRSEKRTDELVALAEGLSVDPGPDRVARTNLRDEIINIVLAVSATLQQTAWQIQAMRQLADEEDMGKLGKEKGSA